ncbi:MAG: Rieske 2Fe-2S domain-containing protein, partial [Nitrososphaerales archaeon]
RRNAIKGMLAISGLSLLSVLSFGSYIAKERKVVYEKIRIANIKDVPKGTTYTFNYPFSDLNQVDISGPCMLIHLPNGELKAYSSICTHLRCIVRYSEENNIIQCLCHGGKFDPQTGAVLSGPPKRPLPEVNLIVDSNGDVYATGVKIL